MVKDSLNRTFKTLRLSVTSQCNFACQYCVDPNSKVIKANNSLSSSELVQIVEAINKITPLETVRITGGEPSLYKELVLLVKKLKTIGIPKVKMTSNASRLENQLEVLQLAGLDSINFSLDAINENTFRQITPRGSLDKVLSCIKKANNLKIPFKINSTILNGINDKEILPLMHFASEMETTIRFLELMQMGHLKNSFENLFYSEKRILDTVKQEYKIKELQRIDGSTSKYWITENNVQFGIIANNSSPFCHDCNRLRLSESGEIFGCLSSDKGYSLVNKLNSTTALEEILLTALTQKQLHKFSGSALSMKSIGG